ncbi:MAG: protein-export chaperone SecB [Pseudomonadota bacterium]
MTDQGAPPIPNPAGGPTPGEPAPPSLRALSQFVKDLSFENPATALPEGQPNIDIGIDVSANPRDDGPGVVEVSLKMTARAHIADATLFLLELDYCGLFQVVGLGEQETEAALLIECPRMLFPFARRLVADVTREGGFPPLLIDPVDFVHLYRQQKQRQAGQPAPVQTPMPDVPQPPAPQPPAPQAPASQAAPAPPPAVPAAPVPATAPEPAPQPAPAPPTRPPES